MDWKKRSAFFLAAAAIAALTSQHGRAQSAMTPISRALTGVAMTGAPQPLAPKGDYAALPVASFARPHVWIAGALNGVGTLAFPGEQAFCEQHNNGFGLFTYCPAGVKKLYNVASILNGNGGAGQTIAIVDAFDYSIAEADLATFSGAMSLPACTSGSGCFTSYMMDGGIPNPNSAFDNAGWDLESDLDIQYVHAVAPNAKILYVQAKTNSFADLCAAEAYALANAKIVTNSWGGDDGVGADAFDGCWAGTNTTVFFSSGDAGGAIEYPCSATNVTCVGGTTVLPTPSLTRMSETGWSGSGGGCSPSHARPSWQSSAALGAVCGTEHASPDVAAIADPNTGVAIFYGTHPGFYQIGGTSLASPVTAGIYADIQTARNSYGKSLLGFVTPNLYKAAGSNYNYFDFDILTGTAGAFSAGPNYDLVTGLGVSNGPQLGNRFFGLP